MRHTMEVLVQILTEWADWQKGYRIKLGYPTRSAGLAGTGMASFEDMCEAVDTATMQSVDAVIQCDMTPIERSAILRRYGVAAVFRFPCENYEDVLLAAHERLLVLLPAKGVMVV
jgi:hypothetical protein